MEPVIELVRGYIETNYDYPKTIKVLSDDIASAAKEILEGLTGEALEEMRVANNINLKMAPLTPDHHFYIDQGANAHVRLVLIAIGKKLVELGVLDAPDDVVFLHYNELRVFMGDPKAMDARALVAKARAAREQAYTLRPKDWIGTVTQSQLDFPYLNLWGFPEKFYRKAGTVRASSPGIGGSPGVVEGVARVVLREDQFDEVRGGDILVCQMTNPAWVVLFTKIVGLVTDAGRDRIAPGRALARVRDSRRGRDVGGNPADQQRRPDPAQRDDRSRRDPGEGSQARQERPLRALRHGVDAPSADDHSQRSE